MSWANSYPRVRNLQGVPPFPFPRKGTGIPKSKKMLVVCFPRLVYILKCLFVYLGDTRLINHPVSFVANPSALRNATPFSFSKIHSLRYAKWSDTNISMGYILWMLLGEQER